jgi:hypothetical protein
MKAQDSSVPRGELIPSGLVDKNGNMLASASSHKKGTPPVTGEAFGSRWNDNSVQWTSLPGGGVIGFDLNKLTLADFRIMRDHYQVNASLSVLSFMMHQLQWHVECDNKTIENFCNENMEQIWTRLVRGLSQAFWAGYSPNILQWENDIAGRRIRLTKIKDIVPEEARVNWKSVDGWAPPGSIPPKIKVYDGIRTLGSNWPVPPENTLWYPLLMENGDYYGKKLLRPAFTSWFFSIIMHLFSNRYFERFGEPVPVGRAPYDDELDINGEKIAGRQVMMQVLQALRNRSAVVLPDSRSVVGTETKYDYDIEYLESQMRGADFERYLMRLDEEISLALFTPLLMLRTADVGSYNLGTQHSLVYQQMLNALAGDWKEYIDHYILGTMVDVNFGANAKRAVMKFRKLGDDRMDLIKTMMQQLLATGGVMPDLEQLGQIAGMTLNEVQTVTAPPADPAADPAAADPNADPAADPAAGGGKGKSANARAVVLQMLARIEPQVRKAFRNGRVYEDFAPAPGYERQLSDALKAAGATDPESAHGHITAWLSSFAGMEFGTESEVLELVKNGLDSKVDDLCEGNPARNS